MLASSVHTAFCFTRSSFLRRCIHRSSLYSSPSQSETDSERTPWNRVANTDSKKTSRFRQHVNPLASHYRKQTILPENWAKLYFIDPTKPLHVDIGCGKGGFLIKYAQSLAEKDDQQEDYNHLGLEIRPNVAEFAKDRVGAYGVEGRVGFIGCNANVDLDRILKEYPGPLQLVTIQYPDPHFKAQHAKRRVVTSELVAWIAKHLIQDGKVFLQSDIQTVLDDMRSRFEDCPEYFEDCRAGEYIQENPLGVPTEREVSVLEKGLPVYRSLFRRNGKGFDADTTD